MVIDFKDQVNMTPAVVALTERFHGIYGYVLLGLCACVENLFPPIPGDTVTVFGGYLTGIGQLSLAGVIVSTTIGSFAGFMMMFFLGKLVGKSFLARGRVPWVREQQVHRVSEWFERFGYGVVLFNRFLSGARSVISLVAGMTQLNTGRVAIYCFISCIVWNSCLVFAGYKVGENWGTVSEILKKYNMVVIAIAAITAAFFILKRFIKKPPHSLF